MYKLKSAGIPVKKNKFYDKKSKFDLFKVIAFTSYILLRSFGQIMNSSPKEHHFILNKTSHKASF